MHAGTLADPLALVSKLQLRGKCTADKADRLFGLMHEARRRTSKQTNTPANPFSPTNSERTAATPRLPENGAEDDRS
jgi:hypothetical protein